MRVGFRIARAALHGSGNAALIPRYASSIRGFADDFGSLFDQNARETRPSPSAKAPRDPRPAAAAAAAAATKKKPEAEEPEAGGDEDDLDIFDLQFGKVDSSTARSTGTTAGDESMEPIVQEIPLLPPFGSDEELVDYVTKILDETPWRELYPKLSVLGDQVKAHHVPEIIRRARSSPVVFSFFMWVRARRHIQLEASMLSLLFEVLTPTNKPDEMEWLLTQMPKWKIPVEDSMIVTVMLAYARMDRSIDALKLFLRMEELGIKHPKTSTFNTVLRLLLNSGRNIQFDMVLRRMKMVRKMNAITYEILIAKACRFGSSDKAFEIFEEMKESGIEPSPNAFASLVEGLSKAGRDDLAIALLQQMNPPTAEVFNPLVTNLVLAGKLAVALTQYKSMLESKIKPAASTCIPILTELVVTERTDQACSLFREMIRSGYVLPGDCLPVVESSYNKCTVEMVWSFVRELPKLPGCDLDARVVHSLVKGLLDRGRLDLARKLFQSVLGTGKVLAAETYNLFIVVLRRNVDGSRQIFELMKQKGCDPDTGSYNGMIEALVIAGSIGEAYQMFVEMMDKGFEADATTYKLLVQILSRDEKMSSGSVAEAMAAIRDKGRFGGAETYLGKLEQQKLLMPRGGKRGNEGKVLVKVLQKDGRTLEDIYM